MGNSQKNKAILAELKAKALQDEGFKAKFMADPAAVLREAGAEFPDEVTIKVVENTADVRYVVLPYPESGKLSGDALDAIAGGGSTATQTNVVQTAEAVTTEVEATQTTTTETAEAETTVVAVAEIVAT